MKFHNILTLSTALLCITAMGSPIEYVIESKADLKALGVTIKTTNIDHNDSDHQRSTMFEVSWLSKDNDPKPTKRSISLLVFKHGQRVGDTKNPFGPVGTRFTIPLVENSKATLGSTFTVAEEELEATVLVFREQLSDSFSWDSVHYLLLKTVTDNFSGPQNPFENPKEAQQAAPRNR